MNVVVMRLALTTAWLLTVGQVPAAAQSVSLSASDFPDCTVGDGPSQTSSVSLSFKASMSALLMDPRLSWIVLAGVLYHGHVRTRLAHVSSTRRSTVPHHVFDNLAVSKTRWVSTNNCPSDAEKGNISHLILNQPRKIAAAQHVMVTTNETSQPST